MAARHNRAARRIAKKYSGKYDPKRSPDIRGRGRSIEVKSRSSEVPTALNQLAKSRNKKYVALPKVEHKAARRKLKGTGVGIMDWFGQITKRARRR